MRTNKAVFLDKDGTLLRDVPYNTDPAKMELLEGVASGLQQLAAEGYLLFVVTNQAGVAKGYFAEQALSVVESKLQEMVAQKGARITEFYYCPHHPEGSVYPYATVCDCRKPSPGMLLKAAAVHDICLDRSWMVGDILDDVEAGNRAGCKTVLIDPLRRGQTQDVEPARRPTHVAQNFRDATTLIIKDTNYGNV